MQMEKRGLPKCPKAEWMQNAVQMERFHREEWAGLRLHSPYCCKMFPNQTVRVLLYGDGILFGKSIRQWIHDEQTLVWICL